MAQVQMTVPFSGKHTALEKGTRCVKLHRLIDPFFTSEARK